TRECVTARPMAAICNGELAPGAHIRSDAELLDYIRTSVASIYHPVGTGAMGGGSRWHPVLDPELRVGGESGLRVVNASVMPALPRGNTNAATIAIAERAADLIAGRAPLAPLDPADPIAAMITGGPDFATGPQPATGPFPAQPGPGPTAPPLPNQDLASEEADRAPDA